MLFAVALLDASIIGAFAVSLSTAYAVSDVFGINHSLHRGVRGAKGFYALYAGLIAAAGPAARAGREDWRMPPLALLRRPVMSAGRRVGMGALRLYLGVAMILVVVRIAALAAGH